MQNNAHLQNNVP